MTLAEELVASGALSGKVAVVTGGAGADAGLGLTTTEFLAKAGAAVIIWDPNDVATERAKAELSSLGLLVDSRHVDVSDRSAVSDAYAQACSDHGHVDILVNNAALKMDYMLGPKNQRPPGTKPFWELDPERFSRLLEVNVFGPYLTSFTIAPQMAQQGSGSIVNIVTSPKTQISPNHIPYGPSKAALEAMTRAMATQLDGTGVRVNAVLPGGAARNRRGETDPSKASYDCMVAPILWLCTDHAQSVSGQVINGFEFDEREAVR